MPDRLTITLDHAQRRLKRDRIGLTSFGLNWYGLDNSNVLVDPVTYTLMLRPYAMVTNEWYTSDTAPYDKLDVGDYTGLTGAKWKANRRHDVAGKWLTTIDATGNAEIAITSETFEKNRGFYLGWFPHGSGDAYTHIECGWSDSGSGSVGVSLRFQSGGDVEIWKDGAYLQTYHLSGGTTGQKTANRPIEVLMIPCRRRELLVISSDGGGFSHVFTDIPETETDPTITDASKFWWKVPTGKPEVQCAPLKFPESGYATSVDIQLMAAPPTGTALETWENDDFSGVTNAKVYGDKAYAGSEDVSGITVKTLAGAAFVPDGVLRDCKLRIDLTGDGEYTSFIYGTHTAFEAEWVDTDDSEEFDLTDYILDDSVEINIPDDPFGVQIAFTLKSPQDLEDNSIANLRLLDNRPVRVNIGNLTILDGVTMPPMYEDSLSDETRRLGMRARDAMARLEDYMLRENVPMDGWHFCRDSSQFSAIRFIFELVGFGPDDMDLANTSYVIDEIPAHKAGEDFNLLAKYGDTGAGLLQRLHQQYAASFIYGVKPTDTGIRAFFLDPDDLSDGPVLTLYRTIEDAVTGLQSPPWSLTEEEATLYAPYFLYSGFRSHPLEIEANEIHAQGWDIRNQRPIHSFAVDATSQDPTLAPSDRPDNWVGGPRLFGVQSPALTSQASCDRCVELLAPIVTPRRTAAEWSANAFLFYLLGETQVPLWRFDVVRLDGEGDFRIGSGNVHAHTEYNAESDTEFIPQRSGVYTGIKIGTGLPLGKGGSTLREIRHHALVDAVNKVLKLPGYDDLTKYRPGVVAAVSI